MDEQQARGSEKLWTTCSFRLREEEKQALELLAARLITTPSRLVRFAVTSLLLRQKDQLQDTLRACIYDRNV